LKIEAGEAVRPDAEKCPRERTRCVSSEWGKSGKAVGLRKKKLFVKDGHCRKDGSQIKRSSIKSSKTERGTRGATMASINDRCCREKSVETLIATFKKSWLVGQLGKKVCGKTKETAPKLKTINEGQTNGN